jgi:hypothetical protein
MHDFTYLQAHTYIKIVLGDEHYMALNLSSKCFLWGSRHTDCYSNYSFKDIASMCYNSFCIHNIECSLNTTVFATPEQDLCLWLEIERAIRYQFDKIMLPTELWYYKYL